jgi:Zinc carboxypeptidase
MREFSTKKSLLIRTLGVLILSIAFSGPAKVSGQSIPSPREHFGFDIGDDYTLATYSQTESYFKKLSASDRTKLVDIGMTEEGRHQYMLIISSPENIKNLEKYREISEKLARAEDLNEEEAKKLAGEGKAIVWIDGGLHATEVVGTHQLIETAWQLVSRTDRETTDILNNVIILLVHANPDGQELVSSWYMRNNDPKKRKMNIPRLYQKYVGHDNNRDFYMLAMKETRNMSRQLYIEWFPQILYNHHQSGPAGSVLAGPPYRDPFNYYYDPLIVTGIDALGAAMNNRLNTEGKPGYTQRTGSTFSTWYNGGLRTTAYFHNIIGLLTEIIGNPSPMNVPLVPDRLLPNGATPDPVPPGEWHFRQSIDYSVSLNYAVLDYATRFRNELLFNIYRMGKNSIERGSTDHWTVTPKFIRAIRNAYNKDIGPSGTEPAGGERSSAASTVQLPLKYYDLILKDPSTRDPREYIIPSDQEDFPTAVRFVNALIGSGIKIMKAGSPFTIRGKTYPAGSFIVKTNQAFRPHILDMFEPQDYPNDLQYPGGPPIPPYDAAGWTLAFQMGIKFDRIPENADGPFEQLPYGQEQSFAIQQDIPQAKAGYLLSPMVNNSFTVVNDLIRNGIKVYRVTGAKIPADGLRPGTFYIPYSLNARNILGKSATANGVKVTAVNKRPDSSEKIMASRIAIVNRYGGSMPAGWISWILEQFHFPYRTVYVQNIDSGDLRKKFDVIIFASDIVPKIKKTADSLSKSSQLPVIDDIPAEYRGMTGTITPGRSVPQIRKFIEAGGVVITIGASSSLAFNLDLPVSGAPVKRVDNGADVPMKNSEFYIPGSLLTTKVDTTDSAAWGMPSWCDIYFEQDPVFRFENGAAEKNIKKLLWYPNGSPLHSGWAMGQEYLKDGVAAFVAGIGSGRFYAFGPEITFRSQAQSTFKLIFNQLYTTEKKPMAGEK